MYTTNTNKCKANANQMAAFQLEHNKCMSPAEQQPIRTKLLQHERDLQPPSTSKTLKSTNEQQTNKQAN